MLWDQFMCRSQETEIIIFKCVNLRGADKTKQLKLSIQTHPSINSKTKDAVCSLALCLCLVWLTHTHTFSMYNVTLLDTTLRTPNIIDPVWWAVRKMNFNMIYFLSNKYAAIGSSGLEGFSQLKPVIMVSGLCVCVCPAAHMQQPRFK